jgi:hypothetical protein
LELLGDVGLVESRFGPFGDSVSIGARLSTVCNKRTIAPKTILDTPMELLGDVGHVESRFDPFGDSASFVA